MWTPAREAPQGVDVYFSCTHHPDERATRFRHELLVTQDEPAEEQAQRLAAQILADDPRKTAEVCDD
ncbi:hypothetical protein ACFU5O_18010 [Streptomyces sp. NPDC057445]|uniref:hypothetical protein n=1 Tax=Streptomyces sp. NPDC057445 TaxID=3346136 RepID=UPI0036744FC6